jgi:hypothetical protein
MTANEFLLYKAPSQLAGKMYKIRRPRGEWFTPTARIIRENFSEPGSEPFGGLASYDL